MKILKLLVCLVTMNAYAHPPEKSVIDTHAHIACLGEKSNCYISDQMKKGIKFKFLLGSFGVSQSQIEKEGDEVVAQALDKYIQKSKYVKKVVVLALDGYIDSEKESGVDENSTAQGKMGLDLQKTSLFVPNEHVYQLTKKYSNFYFGASINPNRKNALALLDEAAKNGAVLVKLIPNTMGINLADEKYTPFYRKLVEYKIPLLVHIGNETLFKPSENSLGDPRNLELPLKLGVKVIGAHLGTTGDSDEVENFDHFLDMSKRFPNLYSDFSGMTNLNRKKYTGRAIQDKSILSRILYASDYPLNNFVLGTSPVYQYPKIPLKKILHISRIKNPFDRDVELKEAMGMKEANFNNYKDVLRIPSQ